MNSQTVQEDGKILVGGGLGTLNEAARSCIGRLNADGTLDATFDPGLYGTVETLAVQADGKILVGGACLSLDGAHNYLVRLNADGSLDAGFNPGADYEVNALGMRADGGILVGGLFSSLGGVWSPYAAGLHNTVPATGTFGSSGSTLTWLRGGAAPEAWQTTFEASTNGTDWTLLGSGTRISGGWQTKLADWDGLLSAFVEVAAELGE